VEVYYEDQRLQRLMGNDARLQRKYGQQMASKIKQRVAELEAVDNVMDLRHLPGRWHELSADRTGQYSGDLVHPQRLIFEPADSPPPQHPGGGIDWSLVTEVVVIEIADTH
jgi:proteic killer suppression protein